MKAPMNHLDECQLASYALQLSIYQWILEREYDMRFGDRVLLSLHPEGEFVSSVPYLKDEVNYIMAERMELIAARKACADKNELFRCSLSQKPAVDGVRLTTGEIAMEKEAKRRGLQYSIDVQQRHDFECAVTKEKVSRAKLTKSGTWRERMPEHPVRPFATA